jgi:hypothetical protein
MENESVPGEHPYLPPIAVVHLEHILAGPNPNLYLAAALDERYATVGEPLPLRYEFTWQHLNRGRYAEEALIQGAINCIDPRSGAFVVSKCAYVLEIDCWLCIAYEFDGVDRFLLITGSFDQAKLGIFFPDSSLLVVGQVEPGWDKIGIDCCTQLNRHIGSAEDWSSPANAHAKTRCSGILHVGFTKNLGHYMWNDLAGIELALQAGSVRNIETVLIGPHDFFPVEEIFPELGSSGVHFKRKSAPFPPCVRHYETLPLRLSGNRISQELRQRIVSFAIRANSIDLNDLVRLNDDGLNLWFNLRSHNKTWLGQAEGIVDIANCVKRSLRPSQVLRLFLDGTPDTKSVAESIRLRTNGSTEVIDATDVSLSKSVVFTSLIDLHVSVIGSGMTIPHWIMGRRGVAHSNRIHLNQQTWWNSVSEATRDVVFVSTPMITDHAGSNGLYVNYDMPPSAVIDKLSPLFSQVNISLRRTAVTQMLALASQERWSEAARRVILV